MEISGLRQVKYTEMLEVFQRSALPVVLPIVTFDDEYWTHRLNLKDVVDRYVQPPTVEIVIVR